MKLAHVRQLVKNLGKFTDIMLDKVFFCDDSISWQNFHLSDHPVALHIEKEHLGPTRGLGIGVPFIQIDLPLSADVMLCAFDRSVLGNLHRIRDQPINEGAGEALKALREGRIAPSQMKAAIDGAREYDFISPMLDASSSIRLVDSISLVRRSLNVRPHCTGKNLEATDPTILNPAGSIAR